MARTVPPADPIDLAAAALVSRLAPDIAAEIAATLRRFGVSPSFLSRPRPVDRTAAARKRRQRSRDRVTANGDAAAAALSCGV